jgi:ADP-dependent NAD(P)H-hydrate dehydratase / NAD(P)H-hydrate epimerase
MRKADSHKGQNGSVAVIGGSATMHGAPLFSALAAEASGVDLLYVSLPACHADAAKYQSLNFQVHPFAGDDFAEKDIGMLLRMLATVDCAVIGPGIARTDAALKALKNLIESAPCPLVLDASALQPWTAEAVRGRDAVLTPHLGELERMGLAAADLPALARESGLTMLLKGPLDRVFSPSGTEDVSGGNAGLTAGGTGDVLAGLVGGLRAQGIAAYDACVLASKIVKHAAEELSAEYGYAYGARRVVGKIPSVLKMFTA